MDENNNKPIDTVDIPPRKRDKYYKSERMYKYQWQWQKVNTTRCSLTFVNTTDADIIAYLADKKPQTEIKRLIREEIARQAKKAGEGEKKC